MILSPFAIVSWSLRPDLVASALLCTVQQFICLEERLRHIFKMRCTDQSAADGNVQLRIFLMNQRHEVAAVVDDKMRLCLDYAAGMRFIFLRRGAVPCINIKTCLNKSSRNIILCG